MICIDASVIIAFLLPETMTTLAERAIGNWRETNQTLVAPALLPFEVVSGVRRAIHTKRISPEQGDEAFESFRDLPIDIRTPTGLFTRMWDIGRRLEPVRLYDSSYLALAEIEDCDIWTADGRFVRFVAGRSPRLRWLGDA